MKNIFNSKSFRQRHLLETNYYPYEKYKEANDIGTECRNIKS